MTNHNYTEDEFVGPTNDSGSDIIASSSDDDLYFFTRNQVIALAIVPRIAACISLVCGIYMAKTAYGYRHRKTGMYHRLMFGLSMHVILYSTWHVIGTAAVPINTPDTFGNIGTITTCTIQGFFLQLSYCISFYYVILSFYSFIAVRNNFNLVPIIKRYFRGNVLLFEGTFHILVHIFPVGSAIYLVTIDAYNPTGHLGCWIASKPFGCGIDSSSPSKNDDVDVDDNDDDIIPCTRGPQNIEFIAWMFGGLPALFVLIIPTVVMIILYLEVRRKQSTIQIKAISVAKQSSLYLFGLYWCYIFPMINNGIQRIGVQRKFFPTAILAGININLQGVWFLLIYRHFHIRRRRTTTATNNNDHSMNSTATTSGDVKKTNNENSEKNCKGGRSNDGNCTSSKPSEVDLTTTTTSPSISSTTTLTFNIFDGTSSSYDPSSPFAKYIFDGDSEDEHGDQLQSQQWNTIQRHV